MAARDVGDDEELAARWQDICSGVASTQQELLKQVEASGVPAQWFLVLHALLRAPENRMPMSGLARDLSMTSGGFTKLADRIAREGLIDRRGSSGDRRVVYATLTDQGRQVARQATRSYYSALHVHVSDVMSVPDQTTLARLAQVLHQANAREPAIAPEPAKGESQTITTAPPRIGMRRAGDRPSP